MAEFCLECFNKLNDTNYKKADVILTRDLDLCEGCGEMKPVVVDLRGDGCLFSLFELLFGS